MPDRFIESHIRAVPMFNGIPDAQFQKIAQAFRAQRYNTGDVIFYEGTPTRGMHIFVEGQAVLMTTGPDGSRQNLGLVRENTHINDEAIFRDGVQTATLQAIRPVTTLLLTRADFNNLIALNPDVGQVLGLGGSIGPASKAQPMHKKQFKTQRENEEVIYQSRRHWWAYGRWMWLPLMIAISLFSLAAVTSSVGVISVMFAFLGTLIPAVMALYVYLEWSNDSVIVTDQRVIRITHTILTFSEVINELAIESVQEANAEIPAANPFARIFNFGNVELKTAGRQGNLILDFMPAPSKLQELILEDHRYRMQILNTREKQEMRAEMERWINPQQPPFPQGKHNTPAQSNKRTYPAGSGPLSPFVPMFFSDEGGTVYRKHWIVWFGRVNLPILWLLGSFTFALLWLFAPTLQSLGIIGFAIVMVLFLIGGSWLFLADWDWRHDYYMIDDTHINIVNQRPLWLQSENDQILLKQVDNVIAESHGIWQRIFGFGDVRIALVGADQSKLFDNVGDPIAVQGEISRRRARIRQQEEEGQARAQREIIGEYFQLYDQARYGDTDSRPLNAQTFDRDTHNQGNYPPQQAEPSNYRQRSAYNNPPPYANDRYDEPAPYDAPPNYTPRSPRPTQRNPQPRDYDNYGQSYPQPPRPNMRDDAGTPQRPARPTMSSGRPYQTGTDRYNVQQPYTPPQPPSVNRRPGTQPMQPHSPDEQANPPDTSSNRPTKFPRRRN